MKYIYVINKKIGIYENIMKINHLSRTINNNMNISYLTKNISHEIQKQKNISIYCSIRSINENCFKSIISDSSIGWTFFWTIE